MKYSCPLCVGIGELLDFFFQPAGNLIGMLEHDFQDGTHKLYIVLVLARGDCFFQFICQNCQFTGQVFCSVVSVVIQHLDDEIGDGIRQSFINRITTDFFENVLDRFFRSVIFQDFLKVQYILMHNLKNFIQRDELDGSGRISLVGAHKTNLT